MEPYHQTLKVRRSMLMLLVITLFLSCAFAQEPRVLLFTKTRPDNIHLPAIAAGMKAVQELGAKNGFDVDVTAEGESFTEANLKKYAAIIFISAGPRGLDTAQKVELKRYIQAGGGFVGVHSVSYGAWPWYAELMGATERNHPEPQCGVIIAGDTAHPLFGQAPSRWVIKDEFYNFRNIQPGINVVFSVDESSYLGGELGDSHPMCWYREFDGGRSFYMALGHFSYHYTDVLFRFYLTAGIKYAMGDRIVIDYSIVSTPKYGE